MFSLFCTTFLFAVSQIIAADEQIRYDGSQVLRVVPQTYQQWAALNSLQAHLSKQTGIDIWRPSRGVGHPLDILVKPHHRYQLVSALTNVTDHVSVLIDDLQERIDLERFTGSVATSAQSLEEFDYGLYHTYDQIQTWLDEVVTVNPAIAKKFLLTTSFEGREINGIYLSSNRSNNGTKQAIFIQGGIHAREWISPATVIYIVAQLIGQYGKDTRITAVVENFDWYFVPVLNADGYTFTHTTDRLWRKTRTRREGVLCVGSDPNRNYDYKWCEDRNTNACSDTYCGPEPFSEPSVKGAARFLEARASVLKAFIDFHSYSQLWMTPWGYTSSDDPDVEKQNASSAAAVNALEAEFGTQFGFGPIAQVLYVAYGNSADWAYGKLGVVYSAAVELRDTGRHGFLLPADQIIPSGEETLDALLGFATFVADNPTNRK